MPAAKRPVEGQGALFDVPGTPANRPGKRAGSLGLAAGDVPIEWPGGIKPWDPIDQADTDLGWAHRWVTHQRAVEIRQEVSRAGR